MSLKYLRIRDRHEWWNDKALSPSYLWDMALEVAQIKGETLQRLREALFELFAKAGKRTSDEVLKVRILDLLTRFVAERPTGGRRRNET